MSTIRQITLFTSKLSQKEKHRKTQKKQQTTKISIVKFNLHTI